MGKGCRNGKVVDLGSAFQNRAIPCGYLQNEACYRESAEKTGLTRGNISSLELRYIIIRRCKYNIRQSYIFFGKTLQAETTQTDEGELFWVSKNELLQREYTKTFEQMLKHYTARNPAKCEDFE